MSDPAGRLVFAFVACCVTIAALLAELAAFTHDGAALLQVILLMVCYFGLVTTALITGWAPFSRLSGTSQGSILGLIVGFVPLVVSLDWLSSFLLLGCLGSGFCLGRYVFAPLALIRPVDKVGSDVQPHRPRY